MNHKISYKWKELTSDGLLREPEQVGPHYDRESVNGYSGSFDTKEEALEHWKYLKKSDSWGVPSSLVLIEEYNLI